MIFPEFYIPVIIFQTFQDLENLNFKFHGFPNFPDLYEPCSFFVRYRMPAAVALFHGWTLIFIPPEIPVKQRALFA